MTTDTTALDLMAEFAARRDRDAPAIVHNGVAVSYAELASRADAVAARLGPDPGVVAVLATRSPGTVAALLGVLAAGGAYCPVDPGFPPQRQRELMAAAACRVVVTTAPGQRPPDGFRVVDADARGHGEPPVVQGGPVDPAYVLFTSGSTGMPKPVVTPRRAVATTVAALRDRFGITPDDRVLQFASLNWDTCFEEILPALTAGAGLVVDDEAHTGSFPRFLRMIADRGVTVVDLPTAYWHELVRYLAEDDDRLPRCLRLAVIGGEAADPRRLADWHRLAGPRPRLLNTYGCTETTLITHTAWLDGPADPVPVGHALPHVDELVAEDGELLIGGPGLALGYLDRPRQTAERFVTRDGRRYFRTGDRVSRTTGGELTHRGRLDDEVKIRGVRVNPAEVETLLAAHPDVAAAAVVGVPAAGRNVLIGYVVPAPGADERRLAADVLGELRTRAPAHLVPGHVTTVPRLAYTASRKVDRAETHRRYRKGK